MNEKVWPKDGKVMVRIPAGEFLYGPDDERSTLPEYWIDKTPVINAEYARFVREAGHPAPDRAFVEGWEVDWQTAWQEYPNYPVTFISWREAQAYAEWAGKRLPTGLEWEKAARGTDGRLYPWGNQKPKPDLANFDYNEEGTTPVGKYSPQGDSPYGCVDMGGNVWEWCYDRYYGTKRYYDYDTNEYRVVYGGSWGDDGGNLRVANRVGYFPSVSGNDLGMRCAHSVAE